MLVYLNLSGEGTFFEGVWMPSAGFERSSECAAGRPDDKQAEKRGQPQAGAGWQANTPCSDSRRVEGIIMKLQGMIPLELPQRPVVRPLHHIQLGIKSLLAKE